MKQYFVATLIKLFVSGKALAQLNESDTLKFQLRAGITGAYQQGNVEVLNIKSKLDFTISQQRNWVFKSQNSSLYQSFYSRKADNDLFSRNYLYYKPTRRFYPFAIAFVSANFRRKINHRYFAGTGVTCQLVNSADHVLKLSASIVYESTTFKTNVFNYEHYNGNNKINVWRGTLYMAGYNSLFKKHVRLYYDAYWQPAFSGKKNYRTQFDIGADFPLWKGLSFNMLYAFTHEQVVVKNIKQDDKILTFGIAYNFRKK